MNFNVYLDDDTGRRLDRLAKARRTTRNALIREAVARLLEQRAGAAWPRIVLDYRGDPDAPPFEASREGLAEPKSDPLE